ncbi:DUF4139 domain-containing protein [Kitasatospora sp. NPDC048538]|uniref:DUF4139 domain-containing protein n=1 Tax=unclassified Kitasatospora TaxID=2633591 RepID=UPI0033E9DECC
MDDQHSGGAGQPEPPAVPAHPSVLDSVVVHAEGAVCRRRATVPVPADGRLRLTGLPPSLDGGSLRARVIGGPAGAAVTEARLEWLAEFHEPDELPRLRSELDDALERLGALNERHRLVLTAIDETTALRAVPPQRREDEPLRRTPAEAWLELADFVDERLATLHERAEELTREIGLADHERRLASDRLDRASTAGPAGPVGTAVTALLTLTTAASANTTDANTTDAISPDAIPGTSPRTTPTQLELEIELEYGVPAARWVPAYRLSYRQGEDTGRLVLRASVAQQTGEDWTGVRLALSTADLQRRTDLPRLGSLRIGRSQPAPPPSGWREPPAGLTDLFTGYDAAAEGRPSPRHGGLRPAAGPSGAGGAGRPGPRPSGRRPAAAHPAAADLVEADFLSARSPRGGTLDVDEPFPAPPPPTAPVAPAAFAGYGAAPVAAPVPQMSAPPPAPVAPGGPPPGARPEARRARKSGGGGLAEALEAPEAAPAALAPDAALLDYPALVLAGPDAPAAQRGTLRPGAGRPGGADGAGGTDPFGYGGPAAASPAAARVRQLTLPRHAVPPRESAGSFDHRFDAAAPADIPSDGTWHTVTIDEIPLSVRPEYVTVPAVEEKVYATLVLANRTDRAVLAGPVEVTLDDEFLLTAALPTLAPGGDRRLGVGVTESIEVARRTELQESTAGMLNTSTVLDHRVHVRLANRLGRPVTVEVRERVPVSSDAEVRIEERADWHAPAVPTPECPPSTRLWRVDLPPGGRAELDGGYQIKIPAGKAIVGGNRRN